MSLQVLKNPDLFVNELEFTSNFNLEDNVPDIQYSPASSISCGNTVEHSWFDHQGYFTTFPQEMVLIAKIEGLVQRGHELIHVLYSYRSVSQAIPEISMEVPKDATREEEDEIAAKRIEINRKVLDILRPEINKLKDFMSYTIQAVSTYHECVTHLTNKVVRKEYILDGIYLSLFKLTDVLLILDNLKDIKTCLQKDFSRYKRVVGAHPSIEILEEVTQLQTFLSNPDPRKSKNYVFSSLRDEVKRVNGHENILLDSLDLAVKLLDQQPQGGMNTVSVAHSGTTLVLPEEKFRLIRVLPYYMLIVDGEADDSKSLNIFKTNKLKLSNLQKIFKRYPVIPLYGDMSITMEFVLHRSLHYDKINMCASWGREPDSGGGMNSGGTSVSNIRSSITLSVQQQQYDLRTYWESTRQSYTQYVTRFSAAVNRFTKYPFQKVLDEVTIDMSAGVFSLVKDGFLLLSQWTGMLKQSLCWKYTHPCSMDHVINVTQQQLLLQQSAGGGTPAAPSSNASGGEGVEYARVLRYNLTRDELSVMVDVISMIKSLASLLDRNEALLSPYIRFHVHRRIQKLVQHDLTPLLHKADKRNKPILPVLLKLRALVADWADGASSDLHKDYKDYNNKKLETATATPSSATAATASNSNGSRVTSTFQRSGSLLNIQQLQHPPRVVSAANAQLFILRAQIGALLDVDSVLRQKKGMFGKADLERSDEDVMEAFLADSYYYPYLLQYAHTLHEVSDLGDMWYREYFLEMTRCVQFPIEMSLPWILTEHLVMRHVTNAPMLENVLFVLDVYNDAAHRALYVLNQQYMYDEIEAETNLVIDQLYFLLSDEIYSHYKNLAAVSVLEMSLKNKLEVMKGVSSASGGGGGGSHASISSSFIGGNSSSSYDHLSVEARRMESLLSQRHIQLLGRSINFSFILGQNINNKIYRDIDFAVKRFESGDARTVVELKTFLDIMRSTHTRLSQYLALDNFDTMLSEVNESYSPSSFRGRISLHMLSSLVKDILPNSSYNSHTHRFVSSPIALRPLLPADGSSSSSGVSGYRYAKPPKQSSVSQAYGSVSNKVFEMCARLTRGFFGRPHLEAYLSLGPTICDLSMLVDQCLKHCYDKILDVSEYLEALKDGIPPCLPPKFLFRTVGGYGYYEGKLRSILAYDDLKPEVFQNFREIGNTVAFLRDLSDVIELSDQFDFTLLAPFLGLTPLGISAASADFIRNNNNNSEKDAGAAATEEDDDIGSNGKVGNISAATSGAFDNDKATVGSTHSTLSGISNIAAICPVVRIVNQLAHEINTPVAATATLQNEAVRAAGVWARLPSVVQRLSENSVHILHTGGTVAVAAAAPSGTKTLIRWVLHRLEEYLYQQNLTTEWASNNDSHKNNTNHKMMSSISGGRITSQIVTTSSIFADQSYFALEVQNANGFHRLWSALSFLFCIADTLDSPSDETMTTDGATVDENGEDAQAMMISNEAEFGHGFTIAGCLLLHLLGQRPIFELLDFSNYVLQIEAHEQRVQSSSLVDGVGGGGGASSTAATTAVGGSSGGGAASAPSNPLASVRIPVSIVAGGSSGAAGSTAKVDSSLLRETKSFVSAARTQQLLQRELFALFEGLHAVNESYTKHNINTTTYHPPEDL